VILSPGVYFVFVCFVVVVVVVVVVVAVLFLIFIAGIREYLRDRKDTVRCVMKNVISDGKKQEKAQASSSPSSPSPSASASQHTTERKDEQKAREDKKSDRGKEEKYATPAGKKSDAGDDDGDAEEGAGGEAEANEWLVELKKSVGEGSAATAAEEDLSEEEDLFARKVCACICCVFAIVCLSCVIGVCH